MERAIIDGVALTTAGTPNLTGVDPNAELADISPLATTLAAQCELSRGFE